MERLGQFLDFRYEVAEELGGQGQTLLVRDKLTGRFLVRHTVPADAAGAYEALKDVRHRNLVQVLEVYRMEGACVVLEEYVNGCSIEELLKGGKKFGPQEARGILAQVCRGLAVLHERGLVCRNIRPDTIRMNQDGIVKLMDFTEARKFSGEKPRDTILIGSEDYAAPEQYGFLESDGRADIYAAGILLNELLTGKRPRQQMYRGNKELRKVIGTCVQVDREKRYANVGELTQALGEQREPSPKARARSGRAGLLQRFYAGLPGLRSDAWYRKALALVGYYILILFSHALVVIEMGPRGGMYVVIEILRILVPAAIVFNAWNCSRMSILPPLLRPHFRIILATVAWVLLDAAHGLFP